MKIVVLAGGLCTERDVSLASGAGICRALLNRGHQALLIDVFMGIFYDGENLEELFTLPGANLEIANKISTVEPDLELIKASRKDQSPCMIGENVLKLCQLADITFLGLHGGIGENGQLQATFDVFGIKYTGPNYLSSGIAMDKDLTKQIFKANGIKTPGGVLLHKKAQNLSLNDLGLSLPVVVKPSIGGSSIGVYLPETESEYYEVVEKAFEYENEVLVEPFISGREFTCGYIDGSTLPIIEIIPKSGFFDYANKYQDGMTEEICPAPIDVCLANQISEITKKVCSSLKIDVYSRADFIVTPDNEIYCLEVNTLPGMTSNSLIPKSAEAIGVSYEDLCELIIEKSLKRYQ